MTDRLFYCLRDPGRTVVPDIHFICLSKIYCEFIKKKSYALKLYMKKGHIRSNYTWKKNYLAERGFLEFLSADTDSPKPFCSRASGSMYNGAFPWKRP